MGQVRLDLDDEIYDKLRILGAIRKSGGIKPECEEAVKYWLAIHTTKENNLTPDPCVPGAISEKKLSEMIGPWRKIILKPETPRKAREHAREKK